MRQIELDEMPEPGGLRLVTGDGQVLVIWGRTLVYCYDLADSGMRNLAIVASTDAGRRVDEVAALFGLTATYVSMLRGRARAQGSAGLVRRRGRPPKLTPRQVAQAREWAGAGWTQQAIAERLGVSRSAIGELLARVGAAPVQEVLAEPTEPEPTEPEPTGAESPATEAPASASEATTRAATQAPAPQAGEAGRCDLESVAGTALLPVPGSARITEGAHRSRYAGAMLLYPYLHMVGAEGIFGTLTGGPARRYDDLAVLATATLGFALGVDTVEGTKHLSRAEAGAAVGLARTPELATFRARLSALADGCDPLALQRAFAAGMLTADPPPSCVYFVDDHFVPYTGARPVAKGWNTKRRHAEAGRDDTLVVDARGRAVVFGSGEPSGLAATMVGVLAQLRQVIGPRAPVMLAFDRGGAYPVAFTACRDAGAHWLTYRRAPWWRPPPSPASRWSCAAGNPTP